MSIGHSIMPADRATDNRLEKVLVSVHAGVQCTSAGES